jgi:uncharacterized protein YbjT (DUF2867 family)
VGANGQLGARSCTRLLEAGHQVRGSVRSAARALDLADRGVEVGVADVTAAEGLTGVLDGVDCVLLTANAAVPRAGDDPKAVGEGLRRLVEDAAAAGVGRFVLVSVPESPVDAQVPPIRSKRVLERQLAASTMEHAVVRFPPFMESWLALVGSTLPLRGEPFATIGRPSPFLRRFRAVTGSLVEDRGLMLVPGKASRRNAFIALDDVAAVCAKAVDAPEVAGKVVEVGGPEVLTWTDVAAAFGEVLHRRVRVVPAPGWVFGVLSTVAAPLAQVPAATLGLDRYLAAAETAWSAGGGLLDPASMTTVATFLAAKAALPTELPVVA